jgi:hypothetical protein
MEHLAKQDLLKIIEFYKNKTSELELQFVIMQINKNGQIENITETLQNRTVDFQQQLEKMRQDSSDLLELERQSKEKEISLILKKYNIEKEVKKKTTKNS